MNKLNTKSLKSNRKIKINFDGGDLSSDAGLLPLKEFACKIGFMKLLKYEFNTNDSAKFHLHKDYENMWQVIFRILGTYFEDDCADELTTEPVLTCILEKRCPGLTGNSVTIF